jgi:predicted TPR repeat methyltransferase/Flp pilus assembly protein TadD
MDMELPSPEQVAAILPKWRAEHPRLEAMLERYGEPVKALRHMGLLLWQQGDLGPATQMLAGAVSLSPAEAPLWSGLGGVLFAAGHRAEAASCIKSALGRDPMQATDWLMLGTIHSTEPDTSVAEEAFLNALQCDPNSPDAVISLGLLYARAKRYAEAARCLKDAVAAGAENPAVHTCLAQTLFNLGDFPGAARSFAEAVRRKPDDSPLRQKFGQARFIEAVLDGTVEDGLAAYQEATGGAPEDFDKLTRDSFHILSGYGHLEAAIRLGEALQARKPGDPIQAYLLAALRQKPMDRAPDDYVTAYFDKFAETFDQQLVEVLDYHGPEKLHALVAAQGRPLTRLLDLGCGTGLAGPLLKAPGRVLTGVDLSPRMLEKAAARQAYDHLIASEAIAYLGQQEHGFDLIFAADFLVYVGDLAPLLRHAARLLAPGGLLALTIETTADGTYRLLPSGRFAHRPAYIEDLGRGSFGLLRQEPTMIRLEANRPVDGALMLFERV